MRLVFSSDGLAEGLPILSPAAASAADDNNEPPASDGQPAAVTELRLEAFPEAGSSSGGSGVVSRSNSDGGGSTGGPEAVGAAPHLLARLEDGTLLAYRAFAPSQACGLSNVGHFCIPIRQQSIAWTPLGST